MSQGSNEASSPPLWWVEMGLFGKVNPQTKLLRSYDTGRQNVGQQFFSRWNFWFDLDAGLEPRLEGSIQTGSAYGATMNVMIDEQTTMGPLGGPYNRPFRSGRYYVLVTTSVGVTSFHFGVVAVPPRDLFPNTAGRSRNTPKPLGELVSYVGDKNSFYTYFPRARIGGSSGPGPLTPDFASPTPYAPSPDWYSFTLRRARRVRLETTGSIPGPTYVIYMPNGLVSVMKGGQTVDLIPGTHLLAVHDQVTTIFGGGGGGGELSIIRDPKEENFEHYIFQLSAQP